MEQTRAQSIFSVVLPENLREWELKERKRRKGKESKLRRERLRVKKGVGTCGRKKQKTRQRPS